MNQADRWITRMFSISCLIYLLSCMIVGVLTGEFYDIIICSSVIVIVSLLVMVFLMWFFRWRLRNAD